MNQKASGVLQNLYARSPAARHVGDHARAVLVFPEILKAGFIVGAQQGDGTLFLTASRSAITKLWLHRHGSRRGLRNSAMRLFFMTDGDLAYLRKSGGWEIGTGPSLVIVDTGMAKSLTTTTLRKGVYAFVFSQKGLMAGLGLTGNENHADSSGLTGVFGP